ncbi:acyltransferase [Photobacterium kasasachensis]|uniref:acyltransferase n=1 Tax=Photobacterium kasasachensis TaxID=2910240 RepID=UPI003D10CE5E
MKLKLGLLLIISCLPFNALRLLLYRCLFKYEIGGSSKIGMFNILICDKCRIENASIGNFNFIKVASLNMRDNAVVNKLNKFSNINELVLCQNSVIVKNNSFVGTRDGVSPYKERECLFLGRDSLIVSDAHFDLSDTIKIGNNVVFGGTEHQVWTHGFNSNRVKIQAPITIENNVYFGSRCTILPGVTICSDVELGASTTVSKNINESGFYVSSQLLQKKRETQLDLSNAVIHNNSTFLIKDNTIKS